MLMEKGLEQGYFPGPAKSLFILDVPGQEEAAKKIISIRGVVLNFVNGSRYLGAYLGPQEDLEMWLKP